MALPKKGDTLTCPVCGMEIEVKTPCNSEKGEPQLNCCGQPLQASNQ